MFQQTIVRDQQDYRAAIRKNSSRRLMPSQAARVGPTSGLPQQDEETLDQSLQGHCGAETGHKKKADNACIISQKE